MRKNLMPFLLAAASVFVGCENNPTGNFTPDPNVYVSLSGTQTITDALALTDVQLALLAGNSVIIDLTGATSAITVPVQISQGAVMPETEQQDNRGIYRSAIEGSAIMNVPGNGRLVIRDTRAPEEKIPLTAGIRIQRSNVELDGLKFVISSVDNTVDNAIIGESAEDRYVISLTGAGLKNITLNNLDIEVNFTNAVGVTETCYNGSVNGISISRNSGGAETAALNIRITNNKIDFTECRAIDGGMEGAFYGTGILVGDYYKEGCEYRDNHVIAALGYDFEGLDADSTVTGALISGNTYTKLPAGSEKTKAQYRLVYKTTPEISGFGEGTPHSIEATTSALKNLTAFKDAFSVGSYDISIMLEDGKTELWSVLGGGIAARKYWNTNQWSNIGG